MLGNGMSVSDDESSSNAFYQQNQSENDKRKFCSWCKIKGHARDSCIKRKKDLEKKKKKVLESGRIWYNGDGTITNPDGTVVAEKKKENDCCLHFVVHVLFGHCCGGQTPRAVLGQWPPLVL